MARKRYKERIGYHPPLGEAAKDGGPSHQVRDRFVGRDLERNNRRAEDLDRPVEGRRLEHQRARVVLPLIVRLIVCKTERDPASRTFTDGPRRAQWTSGEVCRFVAQPWCSGVVGMMGISWGGDARSLVFETPPLDRPIEILGAPIVTLEVASDKSIANLVARLCDVHPSGESLRVSYGALNLTHRDGHETPAMLAPGQRYRVRIRLTM